MKRFLTLTLALLLLLALFSGCAKQEKTPETPETEAETPVDPDAPATTDNNPLVTIEMESGDKIYIELYPDVAPNTVNNFISLIEQGYYDGVIFHRAEPGLIIQGGDPTGTGTGGPGYSIKGEVTSNGFTNELKHTRGVISMARKMDYNTAGSQFFIMVTDYPAWDGEYCAFGMVLEGIEIVEELSNTDVSKTPAVMKTVTVNTFGIDYPDPEVIK